MALPVEKNITIYKGDTYRMTVRLRGTTASGGPGDYLDLTGCVAKAQIRLTEDATAVLAEFTVEIPDQTVADDKGKIRLSLTPVQTAEPSLTGGKWDVQLTWPDATVRTYVRGSVTVMKEITRV